MENGKIKGIRTPKSLNRMSQNLAWVIMLSISPCMPKFKVTAPFGASRQTDKILRLMSRSSTSDCPTTIYYSGPSHPPARRQSLKQSSVARGVRWTSPTSGQLCRRLFSVNLIVGVAWMPTQWRHFTTPS